ncbi:MAG: hypothetical protein LBP54_02170 [Campylobacteraceae bacterium]|jgi:hypothetical protein|nr:hypothetical protein [Campylobacteraceae bacterium]
MKTIEEILLSKSWRRAKTAVKNPLEYTLRENFGDDELFDWCVQFIRDNGYEMWFWKKNIFVTTLTVTDIGQWVLLLKKQY